MKRVLPILAATALLATAIIPSATTASGISGLEGDEIEMSFSLLTSEFYKKVDQQVALDGARAELADYLEHSGVKPAKVPALRASEDPSLNAKNLEREVSLLNGLYGPRVGGSRELTYAAIAGLMSSVKDKYTTFLSPKEYAQLNEGLDGGNFSGVGISIQVDEKTKLLLVNEVIPDGPAEHAGLQAGDTITLIDGKSTKGLTTDQDAKLLRGDKGTIVKLTIVRDGTELPEIAVTRDMIHQPSVYSKLLDGGIGYARLTVFGQNTADELTQALTKLQAQGAKAYILDLRDNGGGYLNSAIDVSSKFISSGPIVARQQVHGLRLGDHLRRDSRRRRRRADRREDLRQGRRSDDPPAARRFRSEDHERALSHPARPRHQPRRHPTRHRFDRTAHRQTRRPANRPATPVGRNLPRRKDRLRGNLVLCHAERRREAPKSKHRRIYALHRWPFDCAPAALRSG